MLESLRMIILPDIIKVYAGEITLRAFSREDVLFLENLVDRTDDRHKARNVIPHPFNCINKLLKWRGNRQRVHVFHTFDTERVRTNTFKRYDTAAPTHGSCVERDLRWLQLQIKFDEKM